MTWLSWLMLAAIVAGTAAVTGLKAKGTCRVAGTHLMSAARTALVVIVIIIAIVVLRDLTAR